MKKYILTIDEGTTSLRAVLFDVKKQKIKRFERAYLKLVEPKPGWVEEDANDIWDKTVACLKKVMKGIKPEQVYGLGIANQRETIVAWDKKTGKALTNAIIWKCRRTAKYCEELKQKTFAQVIQNKTGLIVNSYFSATKIKWLLENVKSVQKAYAQRRLCIGTIESYLVYRLTNCTVFVTDVTNASRTMLFNIRTLKWDDKLLKFFNIPKDILARPVDNDRVVGFTRLLGGPIKIAGLIGDQQSSLLGQGCINKGDMKNTYGTGCFFLANIGHRPIKSNHNLLTTIATKIDHQTSYAFEGSIFSGGSLINYAVKKGIAKNHKQLAKLAAKPKHSDVYLIPAYHGLGCPYWLMNAQTKFINKTNKTKKSELAKAFFDAVAYRVNDVYEALMKDIRIKPTKLCVDGGLSEHKYLMDLQSNILQIPLQIINQESTALGAAICTGLATEAFTLDDIKFKPSKIFKPHRNMDKEIDKWHEVMDNYIKGLKQCKKNS